MPPRVEVIAPKRADRRCTCGPNGGGRKECEAPKNAVHLKRGVLEALPDADVIPVIPVGQVPAPQQDVVPPPVGKVAGSECPGCEEKRTAHDAECPMNMCTMCCAQSQGGKPCTNGFHASARRVAQMAQKRAEGFSRRRQRSPSVSVQSDDDERRPRRKESRPAPDLLQRKGTYSSHCLSPADLYERTIRAWRSERYRSEDQADLKIAFDVLANDVLGATADILNECVRGVGSDPTRHYEYISNPDLASISDVTMLSMALQTVRTWGQALLTIMKAEAYSEMDIARTATGFLNLKTKRSAGVATWMEIQTSQQAAVGPSSALPDASRLADPQDCLCLGLHLATLKPERIRPFLQALGRVLVQSWTKRNARALVSPAEWAAKYGGAGGEKPKAPQPAAQHVRSHGGGGGGGGGGRGGGGGGGANHGGQGGGGNRRDRRNRGGGGDGHRQGGGGQGGGRRRRRLPPRRRAVRPRRRMAPA
jgi:hypothetical protein